ncbi:MAG: hypothetical protein HKN54_07405 [Flavobacteriaceae bacterium]|nr:hypothetical protein [Flavobacteriaceae bacterium]
MNHERANRLIQQKSLDADQLALEDVFKTIINNSFKKQHNDPYLNEIQQMVNQNVLKYIMHLASSDNAFMQVNAKASHALDYIKSSLGTDEYSAHYRTLLERFNKKPTEFELPTASKIPDGSPIGSDICSYSSN